VTATAQGKPRKSLTWSGRINGPVYPGQEYWLQPNLDFRELLRAGYEFRLTSNIQCSSTVPVSLKQMRIVKLLSHSQKQVWDWKENNWKLMGSDLGNLQPAAE